MKSRVAGVALALGCTLAATASGQAPAAPSATGPAAYEQLQTFSGVLNHVRLNYVDSVDFGGLVRASIEGMLRSLDPHSRYVSRQEFDLQQQWDRGLLASPGLVLEEGDGAAVVLSTTPDGPAAKAGIQAGDRVRTLNDSSVAGIGAERLSILLLGDKGTKVRLGFARGSLLEPDTFTVTLKRAIIEHHVVSGARIVAPAVGYVRLEEFTPPAPKELEDAIKKLRGQGAQRLVLDLRGNPGGDVRAMIAVAALFLPARDEIFHTRARKRAAQDSVVTSENGEFAQLPLIVLIDETSASASEMLTGSLQDHDRALVVGRRSFGKALVQTALPLPGGDVVWLTTARVATPSGRIIQRRYRGINPEQYRALAGRGGAGDDTAAVYHTEHGREVRGGGGIEPDVVRAGAELPTWFAVAADSGFVAAIADSAGAALPVDKPARTAWLDARDRWDASLVQPLLARVRDRLKVAASPDTAVRARLGRILAIRAAAVRWGPDAAEEFGAHNDPDLQLALGYFPKLPELLRTTTAAAR